MQKRGGSGLIPYKIKDGSVLVYLQKREKGIERFPDMMGLFGGGTEEGESKEQTLVREIKEELNIEITEYKYLTYYEFYDFSSHVFYMAVEDDFDTKVTVLEGEYGKWLSQEDLGKDIRIAPEFLIILNDFFQFIKNETNN